MVDGFAGGPNAPYSGVTVGEPVLVEVFEKDGQVIASVDFQGDKYGGSITLAELDVPLTVAVDEMVTAVCELVYHELLGEPTFEEGYEDQTGRVDVQRPWAGKPRRRDLGLVQDVLNPELLEPEQPVVEEPPPLFPALAADDRARRSAQAEPPTDATDADEPLSLQLSVDEAMRIARGPVSPELRERILHTAPADVLLVEVEDYLREPGDEGDRMFALQALQELQRRR